jgi:quercetin dioxygenase-like cupin family protein
MSARSIGPIGATARSRVHPSKENPMRISTLAMALATCALVAASPLTAQNHALHHAANDPSLQWNPCPELMPEGCQLTVLNGDPAKPNADLLLRFPPNSKIPRHWHTSTERMILISGELEVDYDDQPAITMRAGDYGYGPARLPHAAHCRSAQPCLLFIAFEDPVDAHEGEPGA